MYFEVEGWRWRLKGCSFRLMWRKWRLRGCSFEVMEVQVEVEGI